ncbi:MAG TPA: flagellar basal body-associated FliL family protein [Verrucomicrobiae bacterium]|jgi:flagellar FliL protein|nr:flagellar basal body-associated FliL family protein [Verrucomicrobiae bacterium]
MATNRLEGAKPPEDALRAAAEKQSVAPAAAAAGGKSWVPLIANIVLMPAIAYALTTFVLIPKIQSGKGGASAASEGSSESAKGSASAKAKFAIPLGGKVLVNVAGTAGTRYLIATMTLVGKNAEFKDNVEKNDPQLRDSAASILSSKTIGDLEKPGMRNIIRAELISAFNDILGKEAVIDIYLTEFAIQ